MCTCARVRVKRGSAANSHVHEPRGCCAVQVPKPVRPFWRQRTHTVIQRSAASALFCASLPSSYFSHTRTLICPCLRRVGWSHSALCSSHRSRVCHTPSLSSLLIPTLSLHTCPLPEASLAHPGRRHLSACPSPSWGRWPAVALPPLTLPLPALSSPFPVPYPSLHPPSLPYSASHLPISAFHLLASSNDARTHHPAQQHYTPSANYSHSFLPYHSAPGSGRTHTA